MPGRVAGFFQGKLCGDDGSVLSTTRAGGTDAGLRRYAPVRCRLGL